MLGATILAAAAALTDAVFLKKSLLLTDFDSSIFSLFNFSPLCLIAST